ncbi:MAG TPA: DUF4097 family beta strand repeat-containing protein [Draconibacterium sp.]|nr:DUF4097 family beta strand repeat-containing protein [Draconibacterium sp.]
MKRVKYVVAALIFPMLTFAQGNKYEYTPKVKNRVEIVNVLGKITLKNAGGNAIIIESDFNIDKPERAEGLKLLGTKEDNTNLGISVTEENGVVSILGVTNKVKDYGYTISIPQGIVVSLDYHSPFANSDVEVDSYSGSLEIKTLAADVKLNNSTGPFTVNSISGDIEAVFNNLNQSEPSSLASVSGYIDVTVPSDSKATFEISNITGNIYNNLDLKSQSKEDEDARADGLGAIKHRNNSTYTLNGGGQKMILKAVSGNIYLRKK